MIEPNTDAADLRLATREIAELKAELAKVERYRNGDAIQYEADLAELRHALKVARTTDKYLRSQLAAHGDNRFS